MLPITVDILSHRRDILERYILEKNEENNKLEFNKEIDSYCQDKINIKIKNDEIINNTTYSIYNYMYHNAILNTNKHKDFNVITSDYISPVDKYLSPYHSQILVISDNINNILHNSYNEEILSRLKILLPEFKITLKYWKRVRILKPKFKICFNGDTHIDPIKAIYYIELNADKSRITPLDLCKEYFTLGTKVYDYYNSILIDWSKN